VAKKAVVMMLKEYVQIFRVSRKSPVGFT